MKRIGIFLIPESDMETKCLATVMKRKHYGVEEQDDLVRDFEAELSKTTLGEE